MRAADKRALLRLHKKVIQGQEACAERDALLVELHEEGETQTYLAEVLDAEFPESITRNAIQKVIHRERARENA